MEYAEVLPAKGEKNFELPDLVLASMKATELQTQDTDLHGEAKKQVFNDIIAQVLRAAHFVGLVDDDQCAKLNAYITVGMHIVTSMVEAFIAISKDPSVVQLEKAVKAGCSAVCKKRK